MERVDSNREAADGADRGAIVYVNNFSGAGIGGGEKHLLALATAARDGGWRPTIVCLPGSGLAAAAKAQGLTTIAMPLMSRLVPVTILRLRGVLRKANPAIVHTHGFFVNNMGRIASRLARVPVVVSTVHCEPDSTLSFDSRAGARLAQRLRGRIDTFTSRYASAIVAVAQVIATKLIGQGIGADKVRVIYNGVALPSERPAADAGEGDAMSPPGRVVGTVGRLEPVKGLGTLIEAASRVCERHGDVTFLIVGDGPLRDDLARLIAAQGLSGRVILAGYVSDVEPLMRRMDVYVMPSLSEGLNMTLLEALALGLPTVATDAGGNPEIVIDKETGLLVRPADSDSLAKAIEWVLDNEAASSRLGEGGRKRVEALFTQRQMCESTMALYEELAAP